MSTSDRLLTILHVGFAIFTLGPVAVATSVTPRYIRRRDVTIVRYLNRTTRIYGLLSLGIFLFGALLARDRFDQAWLSVSMTLFIVSIALLVIVERDQRRAARALELVAPAATGPVRGAETDADEGTGADREAANHPETERTADPAHPDKPESPKPIAPRDEPATVERGRIATISGVVALIWVVILVLMVWNA